MCWELTSLCYFSMWNTKEGASRSDNSCGIVSYQPHIIAIFLLQHSPPIMII